MLQHLTVLLASKSPRRKELLNQIGIKFKQISLQVDESFPEHLMPTEIPIYLAKKKAFAYSKKLNKNEVLLTADTIVVCQNKTLEKALNKEEALKMLQLLSGKTHEVITGVCLHSNLKKISFIDVTQVTFKTLTNHEMEFYIDNFKPFDKAGAYGIQEWIGMIGVTNITGSYFNVVGLPIQKVYENLQLF